MKFACKPKDKRKMEKLRFHVDNDLPSQETINDIWGKLKEHGWNGTDYHALRILEKTVLPKYTYEQYKKMKNFMTISFWYKEEVVGEEKHMGTICATFEKAKCTARFLNNRKLARLKAYTRLRIHMNALRGDSIAYSRF